MTWIDVASTPWTFFESRRAVREVPPHALLEPKWRQAKILRCINDLSNCRSWRKNKQILEFKLKFNINKSWFPLQCFVIWLPSSCFPFLPSPPLSPPTRCCMTPSALPLQLFLAEGLVLRSRVFSRAARDGELLGGCSHAECGLRFSELVRASKR